MKSRPDHVWTPEMTSACETGCELQEGGGHIPQAASADLRADLPNAQSPEEIVLNGKAAIFNKKQAIKKCPLIINNPRIIVFFPPAPCVICQEIK